MPPQDIETGPPPGEDETAHLDIIEELIDAARDAPGEWFSIELDENFPPSYQYRSFSSDAYQMVGQRLITTRIQDGRLYLRWK